MAKQIYSTQITGLLGTVGNITQYRSSSPRFGYFRAYTKPTLTEHNTSFGAITTNLKLIFQAASQSWLEDLSAYGVKYSHIPISGDMARARTKASFAIFMKMLYAWKDLDPGNVDLATLVFSDLGTLNSPIITIKLAIEFYLLPAVPGYELYTSHI